MKSIKAPEGGVYRQEFIKCNKERCKKCQEGKGHGPYWTRYWWEDGKTRKKYIGKNFPKHVLTKDNLTKDSLTKDEPLPKSLTKDTPPPPKSLPKTPEPLTKDSLTKDEALPKTVLPKTDEEAVCRALEAIRDFHARGIEPTTVEVAEAVGMETRPLGRRMKAAGVQAKNTTRKGVTDRYYTFDLKEKIEEAARSNSISSS